MDMNKTVISSILFHILVSKLYVSASIDYITAETGDNVAFTLELPGTVERDISVAYQNVNNILFECTIETGKYIYFDNTYKSRVRVTDNKLNKRITFILYSVTKQDGGWYRCYGSDGNEIPQCGQFLIFTGKPTKPLLTAMKISLEAVNVSCSCNSTSLPSYHSLTMSYIWRRNGQPIQSGYNYDMSGSILVIRDIGKDEDGEKYSCQAAETDGLQSNWSEELYGPKEANLTPNERQVKLWEVSRLNVICSGDCNPACDVTWLDKDERTVVSGQEKALLNIMLNRYNAAMYRCTVSNVFGMKTTSVNVVYPPSIQNFTANGVKQLTIKEGNSVRFECHGDSNPTPHVSFVSGDTTLFSSLVDTPHKYNISYSLDSIQYRNHGRYHCIVTNNIAEAKSNVSIVVRCKPKISQVLDIRKKKGATFASGTFSVWAIPPPNKTTMYFSSSLNMEKKDIADVKYKLHHVSVRDNLQTYTFVIENVEPDDYGTYTLIFENSEGSANISLRFDSKPKLTLEQPQPPVVIIATVSIVIIVMIVVLIGVLMCRSRPYKDAVQRRMRFSNYLTPVTNRQSSDSDDPSYATVNLEDVSAESASGVRDDYHHLQRERRNPIYTALYPRVDPADARRHRCSIACGVFVCIMNHP